MYLLSVGFVPVVKGKGMSSSKSSVRVANYCSRVAHIRHTSDDALVFCSLVRCSQCQSMILCAERLPVWNMADIEIQGEAQVACGIGDRHVYKNAKALKTYEQTLCRAERNQNPNNNLPSLLRK